MTITPFKFGLWVLDELQLIERQIAEAGDIDAAFEFRNSIHGICYEKFVVTCVNGDDPNHWLVAYLNSRLPPLSERLITSEPIPVEGNSRSRNAPGTQNSGINPGITPDGVTPPKFISEGKLLRQMFGPNWRDHFN